MKKEEMIQSVVITFSDGRKASFTGHAVVFQEDQGTKISDISFTPPRPIPSGCTWEKI